MPALIARLAAEPGDALRLAIDPTLPIAWAGLRGLVGALVESCGESVVAAALAEQRPALGLILRGSTSELDDADRRARERLSAQAPGFLSHNAIIHHPLRRAIADALRGLIVGRRVIVMGAQHLDLHSLAVFRMWLADAQDFALTLAVDPSSLADSPLVRREAVQVLAAIEALAARDDADTILVESTSDDPSASPTPTWSPWDDRLEQRAAVSLASADPDRALVLEAIEATWACHGFTACLRLGLAMLERCSDLEPAALRRVHLLVGLAAYNRQVSSRGESPEADRALAELLEHHFQAALEGEADPLARSHLLYRLALNRGRRQADLEAALELAEAAVAEARRAGSAYFEAWARNGGAYIHGRLGDLDGAIAEVEAALAMSGSQELSAGLSAELAMTQIVLVDNLGMLEAWAGRPSEALRWEQDYVARVERLGIPLGRTPHWIEHRLALGDLEGALASAEHGLALAESMMMMPDADFYAAWVGELLYRRGDAGRARRAFERAGELGHRLARAGEAEPTAVAIGLAHLRAGELAEAERVFADAIATTSSPSAEIEYLAQLGLVVARQGDAERATAVINEAIAAAVELGERDVLVRVAVVAGEASLALGQVDDARTAFAQARELAEGDPPAQPADVLAALAGGFAVGLVDVAAVDHALGILGPALDDAESWWQLDRIARAYVESGSREDASRLEQGLGQRIDADRELLERLRAP